MYVGIENVTFSGIKERKQLTVPPNLSLFLFPHSFFLPDNLDVFFHYKMQG